MDRLEFIALIPNAPGYPGLQTWSASSFGFGLEVVGTAVSAGSRTPLEETSSGEFITGPNHVFVIRLNIVSRVARQILEILSFLQDCLRSVLQQHWSLSFAGFCWRLLLSLGLTSAVEGACSQGFLNRFLQTAPLLECAYHIQQSVGVFR